MAMYVYLYDSFLKSRRFDSQVKAIETRLTDFGIAGKIVRLQHFTSAPAVIEEEIKRGATTIVIVGNDTTFGSVLSRAASLPVVVGFLPIGPQNDIAEVLGIPVGVDACDVLSRRRKIPLDVGWFNNRYFISQLHIPLSDITIRYDDTFQVSSSKGRMELVVCNLKPFIWKEKGKGEYVVHPQDGKLEAFVRPLLHKGVFKQVFEEPSIFPFEEMIVTGKRPFEVIADEKHSKETEITIRLAKKKIDMIVGKERKF